MDRGEKAREYFLQGYACSQSVVLAFADVVNVDKSTLLKLSLPFGGGFSRLREVCGAISGAAFIIGAILSTDEISQDNKKQVYAAVQEFTALFRQKNGTIICRELLANANVPVEKGGEAEVRREEYYKKRPCPQIVADAANCLQEYLNSKNII
jgi:C_GCAxxG_C_C family probable redox protein